MSKSATDISKIKDVLSRLEPYVVSHGGGIKFERYIKKNGIVEVSLSGSCSGCAMSVITLRYGLEDALKKVVPKITAVRAV